MSVHALLRYLQTLQPADVHELLGRDHVVRRSESYAEEGRVSDIWIDGDSLRVHVSGSASTPYHAVLRLHDGVPEPECSCPYARGVCWHVGAALLQLCAEPSLLESLEQQAIRGAGASPSSPAPASAPPETAERGADEGADPEPDPGAARPEPSAAAGAAVVDRDEIARQLAGMPKETIVRVVLELAETEPLAAMRIRELAADPTDMDLRLYRQAAHAALRPGRSLGRYDVPKVASDVREIARAVKRLLGGSQPERALELLEEIGWLAWRKLDEADDRDGILTRLIHDILVECAHSWADVASRDRAALARRVFGWIVEDAGSVSDGLILEARDALGSAGLATLKGLLQPVIDERRKVRAAALSGELDEAAYDPVTERFESALREVASATGDLEEFFALCSPEGRHGQALLQAATRLVREGRLEDSLEWVRRGRERARGTDLAALDDLRVKLLAHLDRRPEAADAAWESFLREPGAVSYRRLVDNVGETTRGEWKRRALDSVEASADATAFVEVVQAADEPERLAHRLEDSPRFVYSASETSLASAAKWLEVSLPRLAGQVYVHLADRILAQGDSRRHQAATSYLQQAQSTFEEAGAEEAWSAELDRLRRAHAAVRDWYPE
jgi:hypothetical protein